MKAHFLGGSSGTASLGLLTGCSSSESDSSLLDSSSPDSDGGSSPALGACTIVQEVYPFSHLRDSLNDQTQPRRDSWQHHSAESAGSAHPFDPPAYPSLTPPFLLPSLHCPVPSPPFSHGPLCFTKSCNKYLLGFGSGWHYLLLPLLFFFAVTFAVTRWKHSCVSILACTIEDTSILAACRQG